MARRMSTYWVLLMASAMLFSSCTCQQEAPPPPSGEKVAEALPTRPAGFSAATTPTVAAATPTAAAIEEPTEAEDEGPQVEIPDDFPSDVPIYEGAELAMVQDLAGDAHNVLFKSDAPAPEIFNFYKDDLRDKGYELTQEYESEDQSFLGFKKGQLVTNVIVARDPNDSSKRVIAVMYEVEEDIEEF